MLPKKRQVVEEQVRHAFRKEGDRSRREAAWGLMPG